MEALTISNLSYSIKDRILLDTINFKIEENEKVALLGNNGSGKSTLIDLVAGNFDPTSGIVKVYDTAFDKSKEHIGLLYDDAPYFPALKVKELIAFTESVYGIAKKNTTVHQLKEILGIAEIQDSLFHALSKGERKKVGIILSLLHEPSFLIADEPTSFLDPSMRNKYWKILNERKDLTVLFTTHLWEEAQRYADKIIFINNGRQLKQQDTTLSLLSDKYLPGNQKIVTQGMYGLEAMIPGTTMLWYNEQYHIFSANIQQTLTAIQGSIPNYSLLEKNLEDVYQYLILNQAV